MHLCFHGGGCKIARPVSFIRGFAKNMKAMSLKAGGRQEGRHDDLPRGEKKGGGKKKQEEYCDKCCSPLLHDDGDGDAVVATESVVRTEWVAEPETGVLMTLAPRADGTNRLCRLRFREELFDSLTAQSWWTENYDRVLELYSVVQSDGEHSDDDAADAMPATPCQSEEEDEQELPSRSTSNLSGEPSSGSGSTGTVSSPVLGLVTAHTCTGSKTPPSTTTIIGPAAQVDCDEDQPWTEWVEEYEAGVFITVRASYADHLLQLRHVELSRERFGEVKARVWWEENKKKLRGLYSF